MVDIAGTTPVLAAGGIADGRGLGAVLMLGAAGALIGTRFETTLEALISAEAAKAITDAKASATTRGRVLDIAAGSAWPSRYSARTLQNRFIETWQGRERELEADHEAQQEFQAAAEREDLDYMPVWAGEAVDLIPELDSAAAHVTRIAQGAEQAIKSFCT